MAEQESIAYTVSLLRAFGINLGYPHSSSVATSRYAHMRELRIEHEERPYRVLYAFDPDRASLLPIGGDKTGNNRWYEIYVPIADRLYEEHLAERQKERE